MFLGSCLFLPPLLSRAGQRPSISPDDGSLSLRHVGFPCPLAHGHLPGVGCVDFPLTSCLRCPERIGSVGFLLRFLLAALMVSGSPAGGALALLLSILLYCCAPITLQACLGFLSLTLVLKPHLKQLAHNSPGLASPSSLVGSVDQLDPKRLSPTCKFHSYTPPLRML
jgi:hypothetical protein